MEQSTCDERTNYQRPYRRHHPHVWRPEGETETGLVEFLSDYLGENFCEIVENWVPGEILRGSRVGRAIGQNSYEIQYPTDHGDSGLYIEFIDFRTRYSIDLVWHSDLKAYQLIQWTAYDFDRI